MEEKEAESPLTSPCSAAAPNAASKRARELDVVDAADAFGSPAHKHFRHVDGSRGSPWRSAPTGLTPIRTKPLPPSRSLDSDISAGLICLPLPSASNLDAGFALVMDAHASLAPCKAAGTTAQSREAGSDEHEPSTPRASSLCTSIFSPARQRGTTSHTSPQRTPSSPQQALLMASSPNAQGFQAAESSPMARPGAGAAACRKLSFCFQSPMRASPGSPACAGTPSAPPVPNWFRSVSAGRAAAMQMPAPTASASPGHCGVPERMATGRSPQHFAHPMPKQQQLQQQQQALRDRLPSFRLWTQQQEGQLQEEQPAGSGPGLLPGTCLPWAVGRSLSVHAPPPSASLSRTSSCAEDGHGTERTQTAAPQGSPAVTAAGASSPGAAHLPLDPLRPPLQVPKAITPGTWRLASGRNAAAMSADAPSDAMLQASPHSSIGQLPSLPFDRTLLGRFSSPGHGSGRPEGSGGVSPLRAPPSPFMTPEAVGSAVASCSNQEGSGPATSQHTGLSRFAQVRIDRTAQLRMVLASAMAALSAPGTTDATNAPDAAAPPAVGQTAADQAQAQASPSGPCSPAGKAPNVDPAAAAQAYPQLVARAFQDWLHQCAASPADGSGSPKQ